MNGHKYYVFVEGIVGENKTFNSRVEAEEYMHKICNNLHISVECQEKDKHERVYNSKNKGIKFYINRV